MGKITDTSQVALHHQKVYHQGKKIDKWWGKTLYYFDRNSATLHYRNFSLVGIALHIFGYKKKYNENDLSNWIRGKYPVHRKRIEDIGKVEVKNNEIYYAGQQIDKKNHKTLYYIDPKNGHLNYHNFSRLGILFHRFGYQKKYNKDDLIKWLQAQKVTILPKQIKPNSKSNVIQSLQVFLAKREFQMLCSSSFTPTGLPAQNDASRDNAIKKLFKTHVLDVNDKMIDKPDTTFLLEACRHDQYEVARFLIKKGAKVNTTTIDQYQNVSLTPLQQAVENGNIDLIRLLFHYGADVNTKNVEGNSILHMAIEAAVSMKVIEELIAKGADVNAAGKVGKTPLYLACENGDLEVVKLLVAHNADVNGSQDLEPIVPAFNKGHQEIRQFLIDKGASTDPIKELL